MHGNLRMGSFRVVMLGKEALCPHQYPLYEPQLVFLPFLQELLYTLGIGPLQLESQMNPCIRILYDINQQLRRRFCVRLLNLLVYQCLQLTQHVCRQLSLFLHFLVYPILLFDLHKLLLLLQIQIFQHLLGQ